ncbi:MAG TPA: transcriptional regulator [Candidatus Dormibacteraeota bacterium]|jgi:pyrroloquinoline quinone (PQQ) biosynthesis protein C
MAARYLVEEIQADLAPVREQLLAHPYVAAVEEGLIPLEQLRPFACEQFAIISSDVRSVAHLVSRFGSDLFLDVLDGERAAREALTTFATAIGLTTRELEEHEPLPGAHAYAAYMCWLAAYASDAEVAAAYLVNFSAWGENCARLSRALVGRYGLTPDQVRFFDLFAEPAGEFDRHALAVIEVGLQRGVPERRVRRAARLLQGYELMYWDTLLGELQR